MKRGQRATFLSIVPFLIVPLLLSTVQVIASLSTMSPKELAASQRTEATVTKVVDGATIEVSIGGQTFQVVYAGLELPQLTGMEYVQSDIFYAMAAALNTDMTLGQQVVLERDMTNTDAQGRLVRWVWRGGELVNETMAVKGMVFVNVTPPDSRYEGQLFAAQQAARIAGAGVHNTGGGGSEDCDVCKFLQQKAAEGGSEY